MKTMKDEKGVVLIVTLWLLTILTLLAISFSHRMRVEIKLTKFQIDSLRALYLAKAGINYAIAELKKDTNDYAALNEPWNGQKEVELDRGRFIYQVSDEERRINLNYATRTVLERLPQLNKEIVSCIIDWRDVNIKEEDCGAEDEYYQSILKNYHCKNAPFESVEELLLVKGVISKILYGEDKINQLITVYGQGAININTAPKEVLSVLLNEELAQNIIDYRAKFDGKEGTEDDNIFKTPQDIKNVPGIGEKYNSISQLITTNSNTFRISATGIVNKVTKKITSIIDLETGKIKYWREE
ncbi:MAG: helix-hairpin-helix domain-containing protein [bacterium]